MWQLIQTIWLTALFSIPSWALQTAPVPVQYAAKNLAENLSHLIEGNECVGCAAAIVVNGEIMWVGTYGIRDIASPTLVDVDTVFPLASVSKPITATLFAHLAAFKKIDLTTPVTHICPDFSKGIRIHHLLSHTAGYKAEAFENALSKGTHWPILYAKLCKAKHTRAGKKYEYHNAAFNVLEEIVRRKMKRPFADILGDYVFKPMHMDSAVVGKEAFAKLSNRVACHYVDEDGTFRQVELSHYIKSVPAAGGICASIRDMAKFLKIHMQNPDLCARFLAPVATVADAHKRIKDTGCFDGHILKSQYGLGWRLLDIDQTRLMYHTGHVRGVGTFIGFLPKQQVGIIILSNTQGSFVLKTAFQFFEDVLGNSTDTTSEG